MIPSGHLSVQVFFLFFFRYYVTLYGTLRNQNSFLKVFSRFFFYDTTKLCTEMRYFPRVIPKNFHIFSHGRDFFSLRKCEFANTNIKYSNIKVRFCQKANKKFAKCGKLVAITFFSRLTFFFELLIQEFSVSR